VVDNLGPKCVFK
jgi:hypothetical protein